MPHVLVGVTGGIAAYKVAHLVRGLREWGADVTVVPTPASLTMVGTTTWEALTGHPVHVQIPEDAHDVVHVATGQQADLFIIAPATANTLAKLAHGLADNLLTASALVATCPILVAPAMHTEMWLNPATQDNVATLRERGYEIIGPESGRLTGSDSGPGRMSEPADILARAIALLSVDVMRRIGAGRTITISAGGTREAIDPVRYIANRSTGRMGVAIANEAAKRGFSVRLVAANLDDNIRSLIDSSIAIVDVVSARDMQREMEAAAYESDIIVMAAAVSDYRVEESATKIKRGGELTLNLVENPDILKDLATNRRRDNQVVVGFAAETGDDTADFIAYGKAKAGRKNADVMVINHVGHDAGFGDVDTRLIVVDRAGELLADLPGSKTDVARGLLNTLDTLTTR